MRNQAWDMTGQKTIHMFAPQPSADVYLARIIGGNTLSGVAVNGIKYRTTTYGNENAAIDIYSNPALQDGLGYAYLYINGVQQFVAGPTPSRVLIAHSSSVAVIAPFALVANEIVRIDPTSTYAVPGTGGNIAYRVMGY